jgi:hypothetical protein
LAALAATARRDSFVQPIEGRVFAMQLMTKAIAFFGFAKARAQLQGTPEDLAAINAVVVEMTEGFNKRDAVAVSRLYTSDAEFTNVLGMTAKGAAEIEKFLASAFRTRLKAATLKTMDVTVRFIRRDVAVVPRNKPDLRLFEPQRLNRAAA